MIQRKKLTTLAAFILFAGAAIGGRSLIATAEVEIAAATADEQALFKQVFPDGDVFSVKEGRLPHHRAYTKDDDGVPQLTGFIFMTNEIEPDEWGYESRIELLVGMTTGGTITGVKLIDHYEPFGYFSIETEEFAEQFKGKSILDKFEEGDDIDTVARATISIESSGRAVRKSSRRIARQFLDEQRKKQRQ